ncbi:hypothetical protein [Clostridium yunnanense]|uniref:hypothetical protein n=1 Tax=Clostridium yunnanense TaxID=2800325 RepID=UPI001906D258|nr:hypothetical protein [Clostridium yunnanense]
MAFKDTYDFFLKNNIIKRISSINTQKTTNISANKGMNGGNGFNIINPLNLTELITEDENSSKNARVF